jgi:hypothetical protein
MGVERHEYGNWALIKEDATFKETVSCAPIQLPNIYTYLMYSFRSFRIDPMLTSKIKQET